MPPPASARPTPRQLTLGVLCALCYAVGYPVALVGGYFAGWVLVSLGGLFLLLLGASVIARLHASSRSTGPEGDTPPQ